MNFNSASLTFVPCEVCGNVGHGATNCQIMASLSSFDLCLDQVLAGIANQRNQNDPYLGTYNPGWSNYPNFSYQDNQNPAFLPDFTNQAQQENVSNQFSHQNFWQPLGFQHQQFNPPPKSNLELLLENFITTQSRRNDDVDRSIRQLSSTVDQLNSQVDSLITHSKMLENQISQQAVVEESENDSKDAQYSEKILIQSEVEHEPVFIPPPPHQPPVPCPQRLAKTLVITYVDLFDAIPEIDIKKVLYEKLEDKEPPGAGKKDYEFKYLPIPRYLRTVFIIHLLLLLLISIGVTFRRRRKGHLLAISYASNPLDVH